MKAIDTGYTIPREIMAKLNIDSVNLALKTDELINSGRIVIDENSLPLHYTLTNKGKSLVEKFEEFERILLRLKQKRVSLQSIVNKF